MNNNQEDKGYKNPYNPWENNDNDNNNNNNDNYNQNDEFKEHNKETANKIIALIKFIKTAGLKILFATTFTLAIFNTVSSVIIAIDLNKYVTAQYNSGDKYATVFVIFYIIAIFFYYKDKYFKKKLNIIALFGIIISLSLFAVLPLMVNERYTTEKAEVNRFFSRKVFNYSDIKDEVRVHMSDFDFMKSINFNDAPIFEFRFIKVFDENGGDEKFDFDFDEVNLLKVHTLDDFNKVHQNLSQVKKVRYFLYSNKFDENDANYVKEDGLEVTKEEFFNNIKKFEPYNYFTENKYKKEMRDDSNFSWYNKWLVDMFAK